MVQSAPLECARTQRNLGEVQRDLNNLPTAIVCWHEAEKCDPQMGYPTDADDMLSRISEAGL